MHESTKADFGNRIKKALCPHTGHSFYLAEWQHSPIPATSTARLCLLASMNQNGSWAGSNFRKGADFCVHEIALKGRTSF